MRQPPSSVTMPRMRLAPPQPRVNDSHPPLLKPPTKTLPRSTQNADSTSASTARKYGSSGPRVHRGSYFTLPEQYVPPSAAHPLMYDRPILIVPLSPPL